MWMLLQRYITGFKPFKKKKVSRREKKMAGEPIRLQPVTVSTTLMQHPQVFFLNSCGSTDSLVSVV